MRIAKKMLLGKSETREVVEDAVHRHAKVISAFYTLDGAVHWSINTRNLHPHEDESVEVRFFILLRDMPAPQKSDALRILLKYVKGGDTSWIIPDRTEWAFDLDGMVNEFKDLSEWDWCHGRAYVEPEFEVTKEDRDISGEKYYEANIVFYINPEALGMRTSSIAPPEIQHALRDFRLDHPDSKKVAFIMMKFGSTKAHNSIVEGIRSALAPHGITALRADDKDYHSDLYPNVLTYIYGSGFGIAVFERIEKEDFNPNVSLEVGYTLAMGKHVCLLKDQTLPALHTDLVGKLYKTFDPQDPVISIPPVLTKWMQDRGII